MEFRHKLFFWGKLFRTIALLALLTTIGDPILAQDHDCPIQTFGRITLAPDFELKGPGKNVDSMDFWLSPDPRNTMLFVTAKGNSLLEVWQYPWRKSGKPPLRHSSFGDSKVNGIIVDQETDLLYLAISEPVSTVSVFRLPDLTFHKRFKKRGADFKGEPNITLLKKTDGKKWVYVSADRIVYIHDAETGEFQREFRPEKGLETMAADHFHQRLYIPDENDRSGIYVYHPDGRSFKKQGSNRFGKGIFQKDAEGIIIYACQSDAGRDNGHGFIVVSDQRREHTEFEFFDRKSWQHLGSLIIRGVSNTDGIASLQRATPDYPAGVFVAINNDRSTVGVGWDKIFAAMSR